MKCDTCLNSIPVISENGIHAGCTLPPIDAVNCMTGREDNYVGLDREKESTSRMTEFQRDIVRCLAAHRMNVSDTAEALFCHRNTVVYNVNKIKKSTGKDPLDFYGLTELLKECGHDG